MDELKKFLSRHRCEKGNAYTHTSISNPAGSYTIAPEEQTEFMRLYKRAMVSGCVLHLTEKPTALSPMRIDLDFRFAMPAETPTNGYRRLYLKEDVERILMHYFQTMVQDLHPSAENLYAIVMEKPEPVEYRTKLKDGLHIVWPRLIVDTGFQHWVRHQILQKAEEVFAGVPITNTPDDVIDRAIIDRNNWQMYGSTKPDTPPYRTTQYYRYDPETQTLHSEPHRITPEFELQCADLLSVRLSPDAQATPLKPGAAEAIQEFIRRVHPSIDAKRKTKLVNEIFGKSLRPGKNVSPKEEVELAVQIVRRCLNQARSDNYEDWIKLGWVLHNIDDRLLETWLEFSSFSSKYNEAECRKLWGMMRNDTLGMGTLRWWAKKDNEAEYERILSENIMVLVDTCIGSDGAHFDVARVVHALYKDAYRFVGKDCWYVYRPECHRWTRSREGLQLRLLLSNEIVRKFMERSIYWGNQALLYPEERERHKEKSDKLSKIIIKLKTSHYKDGVMKECKSLFTDERFEELLDSKAHLIGFENGVYDLRMHEFREGLPDDYISFSTNHEYQPYDPRSEESVAIEAFFQSVFTNPEVRAYVKDILTSVLDGGVRQERFYVFTGSGSNGKSKILELVQKAIGDYYCILPIALLTQKRTASNSAQSELERTKGRRFAIMQEPGESEKLNTGLMKELSGGDRILVRGLFKEPIEFRPQFKMILTCNELPEVQSDDGGTWRRIRVIEFTSKFVERPNPAVKFEFPIDMELSDKFDLWASQFISMLIEHHKNFDPRKMSEPAEVRIATEGYKKNNDLVGQYVEECIVRDDQCTQRMQLNPVYSDFRQWMQQVQQKGKRIPDRNQFRAYVEKVHGAYPADGKGWRFLRLARDKTADDSDTEA